MRQITFELHKLLDTADVKPPYLLVGQSYGGVLVRLFATTYPSDVRGMVLVDGGRLDPRRFIGGKLVSLPETATGRSVPPVQSVNPLRYSDIPAATQAHIVAVAQRATKTANEPPRDKLPADAQEMRTWAVGQIKHYVANGPGAMEMEAEELALMIAEHRKSPQPLGNRPLVILTAGRNEFPIEQHELEDERLKVQAALASLSSRGRQVLVANSGHHIHIEQPEVVTRAIREVLADIQR
jgi:pimeloyl-ACP methyl ester carboxylesterase